MVTRQDEKTSGENMLNLTQKEMGNMRGYERAFENQGMWMECMLLIHQAVGTF